MAYKEMALAAQFSGAYSCATTVMIRTATTETVHQPPRVDDKHLEHYRLGPAKDCADASDSRAVARKHPPFFSLLPPEGLRSTFWLARCDGTIEIRPASSPDRVIAVVSQKTRSVVTFLLQIARNRVVAGDSDGVLRVWDLMTLQECQRIQAHNGAITCMATVKAPTAHFTEEKQRVACASFFITASLDSSIARWDFVTLECLGRVKGNVAGFTAITASDSGAFAFTGGDDGSLRMWSLVDSVQVSGKLGIRKKTVKKVKKAKETLPKIEATPTDLSVKKKKQTLLQNKREAVQSARNTTAATLSASTSCVGQLSLAGVTGTPRVMHSLQTVETSRRSFLTSTSSNRRGFLALKQVTKGSKLRFSTSRTDSEIRQTCTADCLSIGSAADGCAEDNGESDIYGTNTTKNNKMMEDKKNSNDDDDVDDAEDDDDDDEEGEDNDEDDENNHTKSCAEKILTGLHTPRGTGRASSCGKFRSSVVCGSGGMTSESNQTCKVTKAKKKKQRKFAFITVNQQFAGNANNDPILSSFYAKRSFNADEKRDETLLWPLKHEHTQAITALALVRDRILVTASRDGVAKLIALPSGRLICTLQRGRAALTSIVFDQLRSLLWVSSADGSIALYNMLHADVAQVYCWRDVSTPYPRLVPLTSHVEYHQFYMLEARAGRGVLNKQNDKRKSTVASARSFRNTMPAVVETLSEPLTSFHNDIFLPPPIATLKCVQLNDGDGETAMHTSLLRSLEREFTRLQIGNREGGLRDAVFRKVLGRTVTSEGKESGDFLCKEKRRVCAALHSFLLRLLLQRAYFRWLEWRKQRVSRHQRLRKIYSLTTIQQELLLGVYFGRWRLRSTSTRRLLHHVEVCNLEKRITGVANDWLVNGGSGGSMKHSKIKLGKALAGAKHRCLLRLYYFKWVFYAKSTRRIDAQSTAFNRLFLSFDAKVGDTFFIWQHITAIAGMRQKRRCAMWLLELRRTQNDHKRRSCYMKRWMKYVIIQREARNSSSLVETLSSLLVNEKALRLRFFLNWYRFALSEAKLQRLEEEKTTMQREWMAVQNAVDSVATVSELQHNMEALETAIAQLAFERDEVESKDTAVCSEIAALHMKKSLESLFAVYRDLEGSLQRPFEPRSAQRDRRSNFSLCTQASSSLEAYDHVSGDAATLRQVGAVLGALKAGAIRFGRHAALISAAHKRVLNLAIYEVPPKGSASGVNASLCSAGGDLVSACNYINSPVIGGKPLSVRLESPMASCRQVTVSLADQFDKTALRLQAIFVNVAKLTGVDLNEPFAHTGDSFLIEVSKNKDNVGAGISEPGLQRNLHLIPPNTRIEALTLIIDLVVMFDSVKAHSDMEVEGNGRGLSKRGIPTIMRLPLQSLCKPQTAMWILQHAALLLEVMSPGTLQRYTKLQRLIDDVVESMSCGVGCDSGIAKFSPTVSVGTTASTQSRLISQQIYSKFSMEETNTAQQKYRSQSRSLCEIRPQAFDPHLSLSNILLSTSRRRVVVPSSNSSTSRPQSNFDVREYEHDAPRTVPSFGTPTHFSGASTPTRSEYSSAAGMRPYLGFRVAVCRNDAGNPTLTIHEVTESYLGAVGGVLREGPAYAAGLRAGDQLVRFAGYTVTELAAFNAIVARHARPWKSIPVVFCRDGELISANIVVGEKNRN